MTGARRKSSKKAASPTDLSSFDALSETQEKGVEVELRHPATGAVLGAFITMAGPDSDRQRTARRWLVDRRSERGLTGRMSENEIEQETAEMLARMVVGWREIIIGGERISFSLDAAVDLFLRFPWIREQCDSFAGKRANFMSA